MVSGQDAKPKVGEAKNLKQNFSSNSAGETKKKIKNGPQGIIRKKIPGTQPRPPAETSE